MPVYDEKYTKAEAREFDGVIKTNICGDKIPKEGVHDTCIACISIDSVMRIIKKNYPQIYSEECKYKRFKIEISEFMNVKLESDSRSDSEIIILLLTIMFLTFIRGIVIEKTKTKLAIFLSAY